MLRRVLGHASLKYEELNTLICDFEAIINHRPLMYVSEDTDDLDPLTPAMFLQDSLNIGVPDLDHLDKVNISKRYRFLQRLRRDLRVRFRTEYLSQLVTHFTEQDSGYILKKGDVVLVGGDYGKRLFWPLAKVLQVYPVKEDGLVTVARLRTASGEIVRPVQRIFPLEVAASLEVEPSEDPEKCTTPVKEKTPVITRWGHRVRLPTKYQ
ncbi:uncharacterized protein [Halyomorpha halys]|uniref:uncharacterized protein n=1 Tax=Halyomorpha halys TaxID=286706 RepID=UPI0006D4E85B|nr:uncharacterized protein LOC106688349 [Halyomorpha halys]